MKCSVCKQHGHNKRSCKSPKTQLCETLGNDKRKASCKAIGSEKKKAGHKREELFGERFCDDKPITYKAESDKIITNQELLRKLSYEIGPLKDGATSIKGGNNIQFTLGRIPELTDPSVDKLSEISKRKIWEKYLGKYHSESPASILCYKSDNIWIFFNMNDVIEFIVTNVKWRLLNTGRIKGDFKDSSKKGLSQYLTYEYRRTHDSHFLGANGNRGRPFINLLKANIRFTEVEDR